MMRTIPSHAAALALATSLAVAQQPLHAVPTVSDAARAYFTDPVGGAALLVAAARETRIGELSPLQGLLAGDAAIRVGHLELAKALAVDVRTRADDPGMAALAEVLLAWRALAQGRLGAAQEHLDAAGETAPVLRPMMDAAVALVATLRGTPGAPRTFVAAATRTGMDPAWNEVAPLLDAYARYWSGDLPGAIDAFEAFAASPSNDRFADDARYGAAQAKRRAGLDEQADADLTSLAGSGSKPRGVSRRLLALGPRAVLAEGMRRDRERATRVLARRFTDLLDGDGVRLARAALRRRRLHDARDPAPSSMSGAQRPRVHQADREPMPATHLSPEPAELGRLRPSGAPTVPRAAPLAWSLAAGALVIALLALARRRSPRRRR